METKILNDPKVKPENKVLEAALGKNYSLYSEYVNKTKGLDLVLEWNYYNDGKQWLCKTLNKKKNLCWLSVWNTGFKVTFYFPDKAIDGVYELPISEEIKKQAAEMKPTGKSHPVLVPVKNKKWLGDVLKILVYKMGLK